MVDLSFIGKDGLIIQYEDIVSATGFNIMKYLRSKNFDNVSSKMSVEDILLSYINRKSENISVWMRDMVGIDDFKLDDYRDSINTFQPNFLYAFKMFDTAYKNGIRNLILHSDFECDVIRNLLGLFSVPIKYTYGDIVPVLNDNQNVTYITASPKNIERCLHVNVPFALTICDDYMYVSKVIADKTTERLRARNVFVSFTGILSGGLI